jgi:hypothetical protein
MLSTKSWITLGLLVGGAVALPYFMKGPDGKPLMEMVPGLDTTLSTEQTRQTYYKWKDASGVWQFGDNPPEGVHKVAINIDTAANILQPTSTPAPKQEKNTQLKADVPKPGTNAIFNPAAAKQALDDAKALQGVMEDRVKSIDSAGR